MSLSDTSPVLERLIWELEEPLVLLDRSRRSLGVSRAFLRGCGDFSHDNLEEGRTLSASAEEAVAYFWPGRKALKLGTGSVKTELLISGELREVEAKCIELRKEMFLFSFSFSEKEKSFFHQQRLQTLGLLAGGVAHDFNNILAGILGHITFLQAVLPADGAHTESLDAITSGAKKASELTKQILDFSKFDVAEENAAVGLSELVESTAPLLRGALTSRVRLELELPKEEFYVSGSEGKLAQILVNLVINARDAVGSDGHVCVKVREAIEIEQEAFRVKRGANAASEPLIALEVSDNGEGMHEQVRLRALEPYFSTKGAQGTGLGLATVASITEAHGGLVRIESEMGQGSSIVILLNRLVGEDLQDQNRSGQEETELPRGSESILVVDDEEAVRNVVAMSLRHLGYSVVEFSDPREAKELLDAKRQNFQLVVLDMLMPHLSGEELFTEARKSWPDLPVLIMSGYSEEGAVQRVLDQPHTSFIHKPFTVEDLSLSVRKAIDEQ